MLQFYCQRLIVYCDIFLRLSLQMDINLSLLSPVFSQLPRSFAKLVYSFQSSPHCNYFSFGSGVRGNSWYASRWHRMKLCHCLSLSGEMEDISTGLAVNNLHKISCVQHDMDFTLSQINAIRFFLGGGRIKKVTPHFFFSTFQ